jgi:hypothetical protein
MKRRSSRGNGSGEVPADQMCQCTRSRHLRDRMYLPYNMHKGTNPSDDSYILLQQYSNKQMKRL